MPPNDARKVLTHLLDRHDHLDRGVRVPREQAEMNLMEEVVKAILLWDKANKGGTRRDQVDAERRLAVLAKELEDIGYKLRVA